MDPHACARFRGADVVYLQSLVLVIVDEQDVFAELGGGSKPNYLPRGLSRASGRHRSAANRVSSILPAGDKLAAVGESPFGDRSNRTIARHHGAAQRTAPTSKEMGVADGPSSYRTFYVILAQRSDLALKLHVLRLQQIDVNPLQCRTWRYSCSR